MIIIMLLLLIILIGQLHRTIIDIHPNHKYKKVYESKRYTQKF